MVGSPAILGIGCLRAFWLKEGCRAYQLGASPARQSFRRLWGQGHQGELPYLVVQRPQKERPKAPGLLDQSMDRFSNNFTPGVDRRPFRSLQLGPQGCPGPVSRSVPAPTVSLTRPVDTPNALWAADRPGTTYSRESCWPRRHLHTISP